MYRAFGLIHFLFIKVAGLIILSCQIVYHLNPLERHFNYSSIHLINITSKLII